VTKLDFLIFSRKRYIDRGWS